MSRVLIATTLGLCDSTQSKRKVDNALAKVAALYVRSSIIS